MNERAALTDPYRVQPGDHLSLVAQRSGSTVATLQRLNGIKNPHQLAVGQVLYLSEASAYGVSVCFLDALRHPIANLNYRLCFDGRSIAGKTTEQGTTPAQVTRNAQSSFEVWVQDGRQGWQLVQKTVSGYGHKLITLVSDAIVVQAQTQAHPTGAPAVPGKPAARTATASQTAALPKAVPGAPSKNNAAVKTKKSKGPQGQHVIQLGVELPQGLLDLFASYKGGDITTQQWKQLGVLLECEHEVLMAIAQIESGSRQAYWRLNNQAGATLPAILYERHYFSRLTKGQYDKTHPDISWRTGYRGKKELGKTNDQMPSGTVQGRDTYSTYATSYLRLVNAYRLDEEAALKSCSWGKFQIMGENYELCGMPSIQDFVEFICQSEAQQPSLLAQFVRNKPATYKNPKNKELGLEKSLLQAVRDKDWKAIAFNYNGPRYAKNHYDAKLQDAFQKIKAGQLG